MVNAVCDYGHNARLFETVFRNVSQNTTKSDRREQQGLKAFADSHVQKNKTNDDHDNMAASQSGETGICPNGC